MLYSLVLALFCSAVLSQTCAPVGGANYCAGTAGPPPTYQCCASNFRSLTGPCTCNDGSACVDCQAAVANATAPSAAVCTPGTQVTGTNVCANANGTTWCCRNVSPNLARIHTIPNSCVCNDNTACTNCASFVTSTNANCDVTTQKCKAIYNLQYCCASGSMVITTTGGSPTCSCSELNSQCTNCFALGQSPDIAATTLPAPTNATCNSLTEKCTALAGQQYCCLPGQDLILKTIGGVDTCGCYTSNGTETSCKRCTTVPTPAPQPGPVPTPSNAEIFLRSFSVGDCSGVPDEVAFFINNPEACQSFNSNLRGEIFFKGWCENGQLHAQICTDNACGTCENFENVNAQNVCGADWAGRLTSSYQCYNSVPGPSSGPPPPMPAVIAFYAYDSDDCSGESTETAVFENDVTLCQPYDFDGGKVFVQANCSPLGELNGTICADSDCVNCTALAFGGGSCGTFLTGMGSATYACLVDAPSSGLSTGAIVGIVIGCIVGVIVLVAILVFVLKGGSPVESV